MPGLAQAHRTVRTLAAVEAVTVRTIVATIQVAGAMLVHTWHRISDLAVFHFRNEGIYKHLAVPLIYSCSLKKLNSIRHLKKCNYKGIELVDIVHQ